MIAKKWVIKTERSAKDKVMFKSEFMLLKRGRFLYDIVANPGKRPKRFAVNMNKKKVITQGKKILALECPASPLGERGEVKSETVVKAPSIISSTKFCKPSGLFLRFNLTAIARAMRSNTTAHETSSVLVTGSGPIFPKISGAKIISCPPFRPSVSALLVFLMPGFVVVAKTLIFSILKRNNCTEIKAKM